MLNNKNPIIIFIIINILINLFVKLFFNYSQVSSNSKLVFFTLSIVIDTLWSIQSIKVPYYIVIVLIFDKNFTKFFIDLKNFYTSFGIYYSISSIIILPPLLS